MTDPGTADRTYIGPMTPELVEQILDKVWPLSVVASSLRQTRLRCWCLEGDLLSCLLSTRLLLT